MLVPGGSSAEVLDVPISAIEHYSYCPRQCALIHVEQTFDENQFTIRGRIAHERVDSGEERTTRGVHALRGIPLWSERYGLIGRADVVEFQAGLPVPVEYKVGKRVGGHAELQLCAQALCLEEMLDVPVPTGVLYFRQERRRYDIAMDDALRRRTVETIKAVRDQISSQALPPAAADARCPNCSLFNACLPSVVARRSMHRRYQADLFSAVPLVAERTRPRAGPRDPDA